MGRAVRRDTLIEGENLGVRLELIGVDVNGILNAAHHFDNIGARKATVKRLLWDELGVTMTDPYVDPANVVWRGSRRSLELVFGNVRDDTDLTDESLRPLQDDRWRLVVDYPFDTDNFGPASDRGRVQQLRLAGFTANTVCWIPAAFTTGRRMTWGDWSYSNPYSTAAAFRRTPSTSVKPTGAVPTPCCPASATPSRSPCAASCARPTVSPPRIRRMS